MRSVYYELKTKIGGDVLAGTVQVVAPLCWAKIWMGIRAPVGVQIWDQLRSQVFDHVQERLT